MSYSYQNQDQAKTSIPSVDSVTKELSKLPGIGPRMAQRLTLALLKRDKEEIHALIAALTRLANDVKRCSTCGNYSDSDPCAICTCPTREAAIICVVEQPQDMLALEKTGKYKGKYHILGAALSPIDGIGPDEIGIPKLLHRLKENVTEIILATNPTIEGDATAHYLQEIIKPLGIRVTRLARGLPSGSDLEYADETTLAMALSSRSEL
jgi:recombination protein RecR